MFNSTVLDVAVGLIFTFLAFSLAVSAIVEGIASILKWRSATLLQGVKDLLNDQDLKKLAINLYNHALINPRQLGQADGAKALQPGNIFQHLRPGSMRSKLPAYINSSQFAAAMTDILGIASSGSAGMKEKIAANVTDPQLLQLLNGIVDRSGGVVENVQKELAGWFDNAMDRVSGAYKRRTQLVGFIIALLMAAVLNVSAVNIGQTLWVRPMIAKAIGPQIDLAKESLTAQLNDLDALGVPIGWDSDQLKKFFCGDGKDPFGSFRFNLIAGWLITAVASLFGAPFWFDALQQIVRLKGAGPSPAEKKSDTAAAN